MNTFSLAVLLAWPCEFRFVEAEFSLLALAAKRNDASSYSLVERALIAQGKSARVFLFVRDTIEAAPDKVQAHMIESLAERFPVRNRFAIPKLCAIAERDNAVESNRVAAIHLLIRMRASDDATRAALKRCLNPKPKPPPPRVAV